MKIILADINPEMIRAWKTFCGDLPNVTIYFDSILDSILNCTVDAVVSPANSFGFMDGGIDLAYLNHFGRRVQTDVQDCIKTDWNGEMPVGAACIVRTDSCPAHLICAPTMRVPMCLEEETVNPYLATRAALQRAKGLSSIAFPGMGTGIGGVDPRRCARQMRAAIEDVVLGKFTFPETWLEAQNRHDLIRA